MRIRDREKTTSELTRRYEEVRRKAEAGIHNDKEAEQFVSLIAFYLNYVKKQRLTKAALASLKIDQAKLTDEATLIKEAEKIIDQMKIDRDTLVGYAVRRDVSIERYEFDLSGRTQQITGDKEVSFYLTFLDDYLNKPSDQQLISELPGQIGRLQSIIFALNQLPRPTAKLKELHDQYRDVSGEYEKKLRMQGVYLDYLRVADYEALEIVWREVYQEGDPDERIMFHLLYGDLFEENRTYGNGQQADADEFVVKHMAHIERFHNYLVDELEDVPWYSFVLSWLGEHFAPTLVSTIIIVLIALGLGAIGVQVGIDGIRTILGL